MKIIKKSDEEVCFATETSESIANAIRRSVLDIPILAIDEVEFYKNDSVLYDEVLALRLGLLPLKNEKDMNLKEECNCKGKGCSKCTVQLKLSTEGPGMVYSKELKPGKVVYQDIPLVYLNEGQSLELVAFARLGKGTQHTKYSPGLLYYRHVPEITGNKKDEKVIERYPKGLLKFENGAVDFVNKYECEFYDTDESLGFRIVPSKEILFCIESWGQISAKDIFLESIKALKNNLKVLSKALK